MKAHICVSCELAIDHVGDARGNAVQHCLGKRADCTCECAKHTLPEGDVRQDLIALLTAEAHSEYGLLIALINETSEQRLRELTLVFVKYIIWMVKAAEMDPVEMIQRAALFWSGGDDEPR